MLRKLFVFISLVIFSSLATFAQDVAPKTEDEKVNKVFRMAFSGSGSYMGVEIREITKQNFAEMGLTEVQGVGVARVLKESPAEKAGLLSGDVIIRFNGESVTSRRKLNRMIAEVAPDHRADLTVLRNGTEVQIPITIGKRPVPELFTGNLEFPKMNIPKVDMPLLETITPRGNKGNKVIWRVSSRRSIGVGVSPVTKQLANYFGIKGGQGLLVNRVSKDSPADRSGLRAGDVIIEINGKKASRTQDLIRSIYEEKEGDISLTVIRDRNRQTITVTPEKSKDAKTYDGLTLTTPKNLDN